MKTKLQTMWKTHAKQIFCSQNYSNTVLESNFSQHLNTSLKNTKQKTLPNIPLLSLYVTRGPRVVREIFSSKMFWTEHDSVFMIKILFLESDNI
jgi:hypothetical protein